MKKGKCNIFFRLLIFLNLHYHQWTIMFRIWHISVYALFWRFNSFGTNSQVNASVRSLRSNKERINHFDNFLVIWNGHLHIERMRKFHRKKKIKTKVEIGKYNSCRVIDIATILIQIFPRPSDHRRIKLSFCLRETGGIEWRKKRGLLVLLF